MKKPPSARSRTSRVHLAVPVFVYGYIDGSGPFKEITQTLTINANGALIELQTPVARNQKLLLANMKTGDEIACHVTTRGNSAKGKTEVGIHFEEPAPQFWGLAFPPEDWDPADRKHPGPQRR